MAELPWDLRRRALKDSIRHDKRVKEAIRKNLKELIAEENIITSDGKKLVKLPLRYLDQYHSRVPVKALLKSSTAMHGMRSSTICSRMMKQEETFPVRRIEALIRS